MVRSRLYRLNPPLEGEYVEPNEFKRLQELSDSATDWTKTASKTQTQDVVNILIANLFFSEPDDIEATNSLVSPQGHLSDPLYNVLAGSIRCRLSRGSPQLEKLLGEMVEGFFYAQTASDNTADVGRAQNWAEVGYPPGQVHFLNVMVSEPKSEAIM